MLSRDPVLQELNRRVVAGRGVAGVMVYGSLDEMVQRIRGRLTAPARPSSG